MKRYGCQPISIHLPLFLLLSLGWITDARGPVFPGAGPGNVQKGTGVSSRDRDPGQRSHDCLPRSPGHSGRSETSPGRWKCRRCRGCRGGRPERHWFQTARLAATTVMLIYWAETGEIITLDAYSKVPSNPKLRDMLESMPGVKGNPEAYKEEPRANPRPRGDGVLVSMIPGTAAAWTRAIERFGSKSLARCFGPGHRVCGKRFPRQLRACSQLAGSAEVMMKYPSRRRRSTRGEASGCG